jgi:hypothetical protein
LPSPFFFSRSQPEDVDLGSFGRGQALQRIALYEETSVKRYFIAKPLFLFSQPT